MFGKLETTVKRLDVREGYRLVDYMEVGLPIFRMTVVGMVLAKQPVGLLEESCLMLAKLGIDSIPKMASLLGVSEEVVQAACADAVRTRKLSSDANKLKLTNVGKQKLLEGGIEKAKEGVLTFFYDGLLREPVHVPNHLIYEKAELEQHSIHMIRPSPIRAPYLSELDPLQVTENARILGLKNSSGHKIIRLLTIQSRFLKFQRALALVFKGTHKGDHQIGIAIDGKESIDHEILIQSMDSKKKIRARIPSFRKDDGRKLGAIKRAAGRVLDVEQSAENSIQSGTLTLAGQGGVADQAISKGQAELVGVYEHPAILSGALTSCVERLVIVSPWIKATVVDEDFIKLLESCLKRKAEVRIGYGIGQIEREFNTSEDEHAVSELEKLAGRYGNFKLKRFGDTHAKVLIKDNDFVVMGSFNWLSFKGDANRTFREEWSMKCHDPRVIKRSYDAIAGRF